MDCLARHRDLEFQAATTRHEVDQLQAKWAQEDRDAQRAKSVERQHLDELRQRVRQLEATVAALPAALGTVLGKAMKTQIGMLYGGVFDLEQSYRPNTLITSAGSLWIALTEVEKGQRPGKSPAWRLIAKSGSAADGGFA